MKQVLWNSIQTLALRTLYTFKTLLFRLQPIVVIINAFSQINGCEITKAHNNFDQLTSELRCKNLSPVFLSWMYSCDTFVQRLRAASDLWSGTSATRSPMIESKPENSTSRRSHAAWNLTNSSASSILRSSARSRYVQCSFSATDFASKSTLVCASMYVNGGRPVEFTRALMSIPRLWKITVKI